jgi:hypothetical protein
MQRMSSTREQRREVEHGVGTGTSLQQAWPHTVFVEFDGPDGERFEAEIRVSSVTQAEATEKVRDLLEGLDTQVELPGYRAGPTIRRRRFRRPSGRG